MVKPLLLSVGRGCGVVAFLCLAALSLAQAGNPPSSTGEIVVGAKATWTSENTYVLNGKDADGKPYKCDYAYHETASVNGEARYEPEEGGGWTKAADNSTATVSGSVSAGCSNGESGSANAVKGADPEGGYITLTELDLEEGFAEVRLATPVSESSGECLVCGFMAIYAAVNCWANIDTNTPPLRDSFRFSIPTNGQPFNVSHTVNWSAKNGPCISTFTASFNLSYNPGDWEAVILPIPKEWMPVAGSDQNTPGSTLDVQVQLRRKGEKVPTTEMTATWEVELESSKEPGLCMNHPVKDADKENDLRLVTTDVFLADNDLQGSSLESTSELAITLECYDYGAFGKLRIRAKTDSGVNLQAYVEEQPGQTYLTIPEDKDDNHVADQWQEDNKLASGLPPDWDESPEPKNHKVPGDGISQYEKYRGFIFQEVHERLDPNWKHVFVHDPDGWVQETIRDADSGSNFEAASECRIRFVDAESWTGSGAAGSGKRVVNSNYSKASHATDQHAIDVKFECADNPAVPASFNAVYFKIHGSNYVSDLRSSLGMTWKDKTWNGWTPGGVMLVTIYPFYHNVYIHQMVEYHTRGASAAWTGWDALPAGPAKDQMAKDIAAATDKHIADHPTDHSRRIWRELAATVTHELGHGINIDDLNPPNSDGPKECLIRYMGVDEYPRDPNDRFEFKARQPWPSIFCDSAAGTVGGVSCFRQITVTDRQPAAAAALFGGGVHSLSDRGVRTGTRTVLPHDTSPRPRALAPAAAIVKPSTNLPALKLATTLLWNDPLAGDPLRVQVRMSFPRVEQAARLARLGITNDPPVPVPAVATNWQDGVDLYLYRKAGGKSQPVFTNTQWAATLRPLVFDPAALGWKASARSREFLVSPSALNLEPGKYQLVMWYYGYNFVDEATMDQDHNQTLNYFDFEVVSPTNDVQQARHLQRLAFQEFVSGQYEAARGHARQARQLRPDGTDVDDHQNALLLLNAGLALEDYRATAGQLQELLPAGGNPNLGDGELRELFERYQRLLLPSLRWDRGASAPPDTLLLTGLTGQRYTVQTSVDLTHWTDLRTVMLEAAEVPVALGGTPQPQASYYRVIWLP
jgi:hypothetical protein